MRFGRSPLYCRLCGLERPLIKAHIVPRCILKPLFSSVGPLRVLSKDIENFPKRIPTGLYDNKILCGACDSSLSKYEDYTADLFQIAAPKCRSQRCEGIFQIDGYDYIKLKLCIISILWRMSITEKPEYSTVKLGGGYEKEIQKLLWKKNPGPAEKFSVVLLSLTDYIGYRSSLGTGSNNHLNSVMWNVGLPGFVAVVKVGPDTDNHVFHDMMMRPNQPLLIACKANKMEAEWKDVIDNVARRAQQTPEQRTSHKTI